MVAHIQKHRRIYLWNVAYINSTFFLTIRMWISFLRVILSADYFCSWRSVMDICLFWPLKGILWNTKPQKGFTLSSLVGFSGNLYFCAPYSPMNRFFLPCEKDGWKPTGFQRTNPWNEFQSISWVVPQNWAVLVVSWQLGNVLCWAGLGSACFQQALKT